MRVSLSSQDLMLIGACMMSAKRRLQDLRVKDADKICAALDATALRILNGQPLDADDAKLIVGCLENTRRLVRKDPVIPSIQRYAVIEQCRKLINAFDPDKRYTDIVH